MTEAKNRPFRAKADVENGYLTLTNTEGHLMATPADYSGRIATLLETIATYPHPYTESASEEEPEDGPHETKTVDSDTPVHGRPVIGRVDVFTAYPHPDTDVYAVIDGAGNMSNRIEIKSQRNAAQLARLFQAVDDGASTVAY